MEIPTIQAFLTYWQRIHQRTERLVRKIPPDQVEWTFRDGKWTLGDLVRHLAALERWMFAENAAGRPSRYAGCGRDLADGYDAILAYFLDHNRDTVELLAALPDARLTERCMTPGGASLPVWKWLRAMVEHHCHHRGQLYLYLAMLDVETPPLYGLSSEEVQARSA